MEGTSIGQGFLNKWEEKASRSNFDLWIVTAVAALFTFLLYDFKVSEGGDDSAYVSRAFDLLNIGRFPSFQGPVYPIVLAGIIGLFGLQLQVLKLSSALFTLLFFHCGYRLLKKRIPVAALFPTFLIAASSPMLMYFSSQTYSEAFFLALLLPFLYYVFTAYVDNTQAASWKHHFLIALFLWLLGSTRTVGYAALPAVWLFLAIDKRWIDIGKFTAAFAGVFAGMQGLKTLIFGGEFLQFSSQGGTLLLKDPYNPTLGKEDLSGFVSRFTGNADLYLSKHYMKFLGLKDLASTETATFTTLVITVLFAMATYFGWKNRSFRFLSILTAGFIALTFLAVQTRWDQARLIVPYLPILTLLLISGTLYAFAQYKLAFGHAVVTISSVLILLAVWQKGGEPIAKSQKELKEALAGNVLAGYTPDWQSFIRMSEYAAENVPQEVEIASRKAGISFIYGGRKFVGITRIPFLPIDSVAEANEKILIQAQQFDKVLRLGVKRKTLDLLVFGEPNKGSGLKSEQFYYALSVPAGSRAALTADLDSLGVQYWEGLESLTNNFKETYIISPDDLVDRLQKDNVHYVILASLRRNPNQRSEFTINTIQRYLYYIQMKYPSALEQLHTIGQESLEPAYLFRVRFDAIEAVKQE